VIKAMHFQCDSCLINSKCYLTLPFHHDRGRIVFAVSPRRGEQAALGRRLRRGQQFCAGEIAANNMNITNIIIYQHFYSTILPILIGNEAQYG
jgi:hypothetical protein